MSYSIFIIEDKQTTKPHQEDNCISSALMSGTVRVWVSVKIIFFSFLINGCLSTPWKTNHGQNATHLLQYVPLSKCWYKGNLNRKSFSEKVCLPTVCRCTEWSMSALIDDTCSCDNTAVNEPEFVQNVCMLIRFEHLFTGNHHFNIISIFILAFLNFWLEYKIFWGGYYIRKSRGCIVELMGPTK